MFIPNTTCTILSANGTTDVYGMPTVSTQITEWCSVVKLQVTEKTTPFRSDQSASRGSASELESNTVILLTAKTSAKIDDYIKILGYQFRIMSSSPQVDLFGNVDHVRVVCEYWMG